MNKNTLKLLLRAGISIAILLFLFSKIDFSSFKNILSNFKPLFYICALAAAFIHQFIWAYAWKITLSEKNVTIRQKDIYRAVLTSHFFGTFLPSALGPDLILTFNVGRSLPQKEHAPSSLLFIRMLNMATILLVSGVVLFFVSRTFFLKQILYFTWAIFIAIWIIYFMATHSLSKKFIENISKKYKWLGFLYKIFNSFATFGLDSKITLKVWLLSFCMAFLKSSIDYTIARSLGINIPYIWFLALVPSISIITLLPISIAGLGVRESAYVAMFSNFGVPAAKSFTVSLMLFTVNIVFCLIGGILYLMHGTHVKQQNA